MPMIEVSDAALEYLKSKAEPLVDTTTSVLDRILTEHKSFSAGADQAEAALEMRFKGSNLPSVKFTKLLSATIAGRPIPQKSWNHVLEAAIEAAIQNGASAKAIQATLQANVKPGRHDENGYRYVPCAGFSFQGLEANRVCKNLASLAESFKISLDIFFEWLDDPKAAYPKQQATIVLP
mmetsp:Transcript_22399/g.35991  ORF Transcript_22399/g.35991 Transcript_22399/m.35991 type:complete len:179 (-) Transcript_22399:2783-3319(-)